MLSETIRGAVPLGAAYAPRSFESQILTEIRAGRWVLLLGPRQHGKTSGLIRVRQELRASGGLCAYVDLQGLPPYDSYGDVLEWFSARIAAELGIDEFAYPSASDRDNAAVWFSNLLHGGHEPVVIIVDEASSVQEKFRDSLYGQLRSLKNMSALEGPNAVASRLRFVFTGTFRPEALVDDENNSPFNVCERIETDDLTISQAQSLGQQLGDDLDGYVEQAYELVGGQPYLLQSVLAPVANAAPEHRDSVFHRTRESLLQWQDDHFMWLFDRIKRDAGLTRIVMRLIGGKLVTPLPDPNHLFATVVGVAGRVGTRLEFRNEAYRLLAEAVFADESAATKPSETISLSVDRRDARIITWLHISDLHMCEPSTGWDAEMVIRSLTADLKFMEQKYGLIPDLLFFTGDAAFGQIGNKPGERIADQFTDAATVLNGITDAFTTPITKDNVFIVPGNHDVCREDILESSTTWLDSQTSIEKITRMIRRHDQEWAQFIKRLANYRSFLQANGYDHLLEVRPTTLF